MASMTLIRPVRQRPWTRIFRITKPLFTSDKKWRALGWLGVLLTLMFSVTYINVQISYVNHDFMTALTERNAEVYRRQAILYVLAFALATIVAVFVRFAEERLGLLWRNWLTGHLLDKYLHSRAYLRLMDREDIDNPDQRMTEDVKNFTTQTLSFLLLFGKAAIDAVAFSILMWHLSPLLLGVSVGYAAFGSLLTMVVGRKLINLNNQQLRKEANFRYELIHVREYAESIALLKSENRQRTRLGQGLKELVDNFRTIIGVNRNIGMFTIFYNYLIQVIPFLIVAPRFLRGETDFGTVTQSASVFATLLGAFSLIITQFAALSTFAAVVNRLGMIWEALDEPPAPVYEAIQIVHDDTKIAYEGLTLRGSPQAKAIDPELSITSVAESKVLIRDLNVQVPQGRRLLILSPDGVGKSALSRATAGIWPSGEGRIIRPPHDQMMFVPQRPYTALGSLRDQFFDADYQGIDDDERLIAVLCQVTFGPILERVGGLDVERDWANMLTVGEQQLLGIARLLMAEPRFAFLDRATSALSLSRVKHIYTILSTTPITYLTLGEHPSLRNYHDNILDLAEDGTWTFGPAQPAGTP